MGKAYTVWLSNDTIEKLEQITSYIERNKIKLPDVARIPELRGRINNSMLLRYCVEITANYLSKGGK